MISRIGRSSSVLWQMAQTVCRPAEPRPLTSNERAFMSNRVPDGTNLGFFNILSQPAKV